MSHKWYGYYFKAGAILICLLLASKTSIAFDENDDRKESRFTFVPAIDLRFSEAEIQPDLPANADAAELLDEKNKSNQFFWFQYGDASSRAVRVKFDPNKPLQLSVDVNRDQEFSANETVKSEEGKVWFTNLAAEYGPRQVQTSQQRIRVRYDEKAAKWMVATAGIRTGKASFDGETRDAKLEDKNGNGLWSDPEDRLSVDFDGNGKISRLTERIPAQGMRKIRGKIYAIAGNISGDSVSISEVTGTGVLIPTLLLLDENAIVTSVSGQLGSSTGIGIPLESINDPVEVPVGDWHIENLQVEIAADDGVFMFAFSRFKIGKAVSIADDDQKEIELLGELQLTATVSVQKKKNDSILIVTCLLYTSPSPRDQRGARMPSSA